MSANNHVPLTQEPEQDIASERSRGRSEFQVGKTWFKRDTSTGRIMNGSPKQHKGVRNEK